MKTNNLTYYKFETQTKHKLRDQKWNNPPGQLVKKVKFKVSTKNKKKKTKVMNELESGFRLIRPKPNPNMTN